MSQSLSVVYLHLVFSTKERRAYLRPEELRASLHAFMGGVTRELDCPPIQVGGAEDHIHLLARFGRKITQGDWIKEIKRVSNGWLKEQGPEYGTFQWQGGYAVFSVSQSNLDQVKEYIVRQPEHHKKMTFQEELRALLRKHQIEFDERYVWD